MKMSIKASALVIGMAATAGMVLPMAAPAGAALKASVSCKTETSPKLAAGQRQVDGRQAARPTALKAGGTSVTKAKAGATTGTEDEHHHLEERQGHDDRDDQVQAAAATQGQVQGAVRHCA